MKRKATCLIIILLMTSSVSLIAQKIISGKVSNNETKDPAVGVTVSVKGSTEKEKTDSNGRFRITVQKLPARLNFSSVEFEESEILVSSAEQPVSVFMNVSVKPGDE